MAGLVEELQREALDPTVSVSALLRKVKLVAVKLQLPEAVGWVDAELNGYPDEVPEYRRVSGQLKSQNPYHGWRTVGGDPEMMDLLSHRGLSEPISSFEATLDRHNKGHGSGTLLIGIPSALNNSICEANGGGYEPIALHFGVNVLATIIDQVRTRVFNWSLELEQAGITGEGISFTMAEKEKASSANITIGEVHGNVHAGDFTGGNQRNYAASSDNSINVSDSSDVFSQASEAIKAGVNDKDAQDKLLELVKEMKATKDNPGFTKAYQKFIEAAGDHMKVIGPFVGPLTALLAS